VSICLQEISQRQAGYTAQQTSEEFILFFDSLSPKACPFLSLEKPQWFDEIYFGGNDCLTSFSYFSLVLDISGASFGGAVITYSPHGGSNQKWYFDDDFTIRSGTGMVLDVEGSNFRQGTRIVGFRKHGGQNQKFRIEPFNSK
jgi:hypothetical protein